MAKGFSQHWKGSPAARSSHGKLPYSNQGISHHENSLILKKGAILTKPLKSCGFGQQPHVEDNRPVHAERFLDPLPRRPIADLRLPPLPHQGSVSAPQRPGWARACQHGTSAPIAASRGVAGSQLGQGQVVQARSHLRRDAWSQSRRLVRIHAADTDGSEP